MNGLIKIGKLTRLHGIKGALLLQLDRQISFDRANTKNLFIEINGIPTPFFMEDIKSAGKNLAVTFDSVNTIEGAQKLTGCDVLILEKDLKKEKKTNDLTGYVINDKQKGNLGTVTEVVDMPGQQMFSVDFGGKQILLPATKDLILKIDHETKTIYYHAPDGLIDIYIS